METMKGMIPHSKPCLGREEIEACRNVILSGQIAQGPRVAEFEKNCGEFFNRAAPVATSSGTAALHLALLALGVKENDEVIMPSYVCTALVNATLCAGAIPKIADIDPDTFSIDPLRVKKHLSRKTKVILLPHLFGFPANIEPMIQLGIPVIEDCAQSLGATFQGKLTGTFGILSVFSFYATKVICTGEGGIVLSHSKKILEKIRDWRDYDCKKNYKLRFNYKMTELQAAMGIVQLKKLPFFLQRRREINALYHREFSNLGFGLIKPDPQSEPIYYRYILRIKNGREFIQEKLLQNGIVSTTPVDKPLHRYLKLDPENYPVTEEIFKTSLSIPLYPALSHSELKKIITTVKKLPLERTSNGQPSLWYNRKVRMTHDPENHRNIKA